MKKKVYEFIESESDGVEEGWKGTEQNVNMSCCWLLTDHCDMSEPLECLFKASLTQKGIICQNLDLYILFFLYFESRARSEFL